ncbi:MAG TPA: DUF5655 domain-containing protein [Candidatus Saccharicenans sp.]|nr:DUF5655 domain-containing protein [Candidatus Saccharicenans sp.]
MQYVKFEKISLKNHPQFNEKWVQEKIKEDPAILGLGDLIVKDVERLQPRAGRLDLLLQEADGNTRYEVEIQLGETDESHIIRTIEYWDIERKRYPQYDHVAVIVAEEITSRFLNVINLLNGTIPLVAIQMSALQNEDQIGLVFTTVLDQMSLGLEEEDVYEPADRSYWENRASKKTLSIADKILEIIKSLDPSLDLKYNKFYIGLANKDGLPRNFITLRPKRETLKLEIRIKNSPEISELLDHSELEVIDYDTRRGRYYLRLQPDDIDKNQETLSRIIGKAYEEYGRE